MMTRQEQKRGNLIIVGFFTALMIGAMLGSAWPDDNKCLPGYSLADVKAHIVEVGQSKKVRYVTRLVPFETNDRSVLFLIDETGDSVAWLMSGAGCLLKFINNGRPAEEVALAVFGKPFDEIFPPEIGS